MERRQQAADVLADHPESRHVRRVEFRRRPSRRLRYHLADDHSRRGGDDQPNSAVYDRYVVINLNGDTNLAALITADPSMVSITKYDLTGGNGAAYTGTFAITNLGGSKIELDFGVNGVGELTATDKNLATGDGIYQINFVNATEGINDSSSRFFRLLGDVNGDGQVNSADINAITAAIGLPYNYNLDTNDDGTVNSLDRFNALKQNGKKVTGTTNF